MRDMDAEAIAMALGGRRVGRNWMACCPVHHDSTPSLSIRDGGNGRVLVHCFAGCDGENVIEVLRDHGLWRGRKEQGPVSLYDGQRVRDDGERTQAAMAVGKECIPATDTLAERSLRSRGIHLSPLRPSLRDLTKVRHAAGIFLPAMVAEVTNALDGTSMAIHRTFLAKDGRGKADLNPQQKMRGPCAGGVVRLDEPTDVLTVGEGIETCLSTMVATGYPAWAALSAPNLGSLELPEDVRDVIIAADGDQPGEEAARRCAVRWQRQGRRVRIARPPKGMDFNDRLLPFAPRAVGASQ